MAGEIGRPKLVMLTVPLDTQVQQSDSGTIRTPIELGRQHSVDPLDVAESFEAMFGREFTQVARMAYLMLGSTGEAEEVAQEAFIELFRRWDAVDNPSGFVRTAVLNRCRDIGRRRRVKQRVLERIRPTAQAVVEDASRSREVIDALAGLEPSLREVAVLRFYCDHSLAEIAELTVVPLGTVKSRLHRATKSLEQTLRPK